MKKYRSAKRKKLITVHPALDFTKDTALVTVPIIQYQKGRQNVVVTSNRECFPLVPDQLMQHGFITDKTLFLPEARWDRNRLENWLAGNCKSVSIKKLFERIKGEFDSYLDYPDDRISTYMALWAMGTYVFPLFHAYPIPLLNGPSGSGKSKTIQIMGCLAFNAVHSSNISDASLYRMIDACRATLLLDENEGISGKWNKSTQMNYLLAGYQKGAHVVRSDKTAQGNFVPKTFETYSPKMIGNIRGVSEQALKNRCVRFLLLPTNSVKGNNMPNLSDPKWRYIRSLLYRLALTHFSQIREVAARRSRQEIEFSGYEHSLWLPILTIAELVSPSIVDEMTDLARELVRENREEKMDALDMQLYRAIHDILEDDEDDLKQRLGEKFVPVQQVVTQMAEATGYSEDPPDWLRPRNLGWIMRRLKIGVPKQERIFGKNHRGCWIDVKEFKAKCKRMGIDE